jgi:phage antirepressor YoqD-like protein
MSEDAAKVDAVAPKVLAKELDIDPKRLRAWLRKHHARALEVKGTDWEISQDVADAARARFAPKPEEAEGEDV